MKRTYNDLMFKNTFEHEYTWLNGFLRNVRRFPNQKALIDAETKKEWTYSQLNMEANKLANALQKSKIKKNDVVMGVLMNCPEFIFSYIGPRKLGAIFLAANFKFAAGEFALLINHNKPKVIIYSAIVSKEITEALKIAKYKPKIIIMADNIDNKPLPKNHITYENFIKTAESNEPITKAKPHIYDEVLRLCTSGTTAMPKCVPLNDINEVLTAHDVIMHYPMNSNDITLNMSPWFHRGGCHSGGPCPTFYAGGTVIAMRKFQPQNTLDWVKEFKITFLMGAPANLAMICKIQEKSPRDLSSLKGLVTMGAPLTKSDCIKYMEKLCPNIFNGYGTTETFWNSFLRPYNLPDGAGSVGRSCTDDEVRVVKIYDNKKAEPEDLVLTNNNEQGEIIIKSPEKTTYTYYKNKKNEKEKFYKGWMYTGDTGTWNEDFIVTVCGRKDDMIIVSGENIYPAQIEEELNLHPKVQDCIVTSVLDKIRGQAIVAYVVPEDDSLTIAELKDFCAKSKNLSQYKKPRFFCIVESLPFTATGKKKHYMLRQQAEEDLRNGILKKD